MSSQNRQFSVRPHDGRWGIAIDGKVVLVAQTLEDAESVVATATEVMSQKELRRALERRSFSQDD